MSIEIPATFLSRPWLGGADNNTEGQSNGTTEVEMVPAPAEDTYRAVFQVTFCNADTAGLDFRLYVKRSDGTRRQIDRQTLSAAGSSGDVYSSTGRLDVVVLRNGQSLVMDLSTVPTTEGDWYAAFGEPA